MIICDNFPQITPNESASNMHPEMSGFDYFQNNKNIGAPRNFNRTLEFASGKYFKWAASDDVLASDFLRKCVAILDKDDISGVVPFNNRAYR